ncbi:hypothetical protein [Parasphingorhabdus pacifica]
MTWNDFYQRQNAIQAALDHARENGADALTAETPAPVRQVFSDSAELLGALHHKWTQLLTGRIGVALSDAETEPHGDRVQAVTTAWRRTASENPSLREVLDHHAAAPSSPLHDALEREQRLLALAAGLVEHHESTEEITRVGAAFRRLLQVSPANESNSHRTGRLDQLRKLIPSK